MTTETPFIRSIARHYIKLIRYEAPEEAAEYLTRLEAASPGVADGVADYIEEHPELFNE